MDYQRIYQEKMQAMNQANLHSEIMEELEMGNISSQRINDLMTEMSKVTNRQVFADYNFRTGSIIGILRHIAQNRKYQSELLSITGLTQAHVDFYYRYGGNLPYCDSKSNEVVAGRPMDCDRMRQFLPIVAGILGVLINEEDLDDLNQERWDALTRRAMDTAIATSEMNMQNQGVVYEE